MLLIQHVAQVCPPHTLTKLSGIGISVVPTSASQGRESMLNIIAGEGLCKEKPISIWKNLEEMSGKPDKTAYSKVHVHVACVRNEGLSHLQNSCAPHYCIHILWDGTQ